jgi:hypothetical protein
MFKRNALLLTLLAAPLGASTISTTCPSFKAGPVSISNCQVSINYSAGDISFQPPVGLTSSLFGNMDLSILTIPDEAFLTSGLQAQGFSERVTANLALDSDTAIDDLTVVGQVVEDGFFDTASIDFQVGPCGGRFEGGGLQDGFHRQDCRPTQPFQSAPSAHALLRATASSALRGLSYRKFPQPRSRPRRY